MSFEQHIGLTEDQWRALESISDVFAQSPGFSEALLTGLNILLNTMRQHAGALYLPGIVPGEPSAWVEQGVPETWQASLRDPHSAVARQICEVIAKGQPVPGKGGDEPAASVPAMIGEKVYAVLLLAGPGSVEEDLPLWQTMLRPIARGIVHQSKDRQPASPGYQDLMRSRNTLRAMFDSLPLSIYIINESYELMAINYSRAGRAESSPKELVGRRCYEALFGQNAPCSGCRVKETLTSGRGTMRMIRTAVENGTPLQWEMNTFPIQDDNDTVIQAIVVEQDVTEKRNLEANLIQSEKLAAVGQLAAGVAHEINNPLTAIIANAQLLLREISPSDEEMWDSVKLIEMAGTRASQVVRNLLGIARKEKYEFDLMDINETVRNALALVQHELVGSPIVVQLDLDENMPPVMASQDQLQGVWINLILNAIDAIDKPEGRISIQTRYTGSDFRIIVTDNGKGIAAEHLSRVFEPFFTTKSVGRGTGLGLSVCMRAVRHHGGNIQVESQQGEWTRFIVSLPEHREPN